MIDTGVLKREGKDVHSPADTCNLALLSLIVRQQARFQLSPGNPGWVVGFV